MVKVTVPAPSLIVWSGRGWMTGAVSSSTMVAVPLAGTGLTSPATAVAVSTKVSSPSRSASLTTGVRTRKLATPAGSVTVAPSTQVWPPSSETCRLFVPVLP